jgi:hypothetical protein
MNTWGPQCDRCKTPLGLHGSSLSGQLCDLQLALSDCWRTLLIGILGHRRGWAAWWRNYDRSKM